MIYYDDIIFYRNKAWHLKNVNGRAFFSKRHFVIWNAFLYETVAQFRLKNFK